MDVLPGQKKVVVRRGSTVYIYFYAFGWFVRTENDKCAPNICSATTGKGCPGACQKD